MFVTGEKTAFNCNDLDQSKMLLKKLSNAPACLVYIVRHLDVKNIVRNLTFTLLTLRYVIFTNLWMSSFLFEWDLFKTICSQCSFLSFRHPEKITGFQNCSPATIDAMETFVLNGKILKKHFTASYKGALTLKKIAKDFFFEATR